MSDYKIPYTSLEQFIPSQLANTMNTSLMRNIFDKMITREESTRMYGVIGDKSTPNKESKPFIVEKSTDRFLNSLCPALHYQVGAEENVFTFKDMLNKATLMGIDTNEFATWGETKSFNFMPPIDIDKFINFSQYFWVQGVLPDQHYSSNPSSQPEYYVISRPSLTDVIKFPVEIGTTSNIELNGTLTKLGDYIVQFSDDTHFTVTNPSNVVTSGTIIGETTIFTSADITFDIISRGSPFVLGDTFTITPYPLTSKPTSISFIGSGDGYISNAISKLSYGVIDGVQLADKMRILVKNQTNISENGLYVVKADTLVRTLDDTIQSEVFIKLGSQIGTWSLSTSVSSKISETSNVSIWTETNYWIHKDDLLNYNISSSSKITQALRPIIEYNLDIELSSTIDNFSKIKFNQAPLFNLYDYNNTPIMINGLQLCSAIFYYKESDIEPIDVYLQRRVVTDNFNFIFEQGLIFQNRTVFFKKMNELHTIWVKNNTVIETPKYVTVGTNNEAVPYVGNPSTDLNGVGDWLIPFQMNRNLEFENRTNISFADLNDHFTKVISTQIGITGSSFGNNNFRTLTPDLGLGGTINLIDNQFNLFMGLLNQQNITPITLIDFAEQQYEDSLNSLIQFMELNVGDLLTKHCNANDLTSAIFSDYLADYGTKGELNKTYEGSLCPIVNWPMTLPLLGVMNAVEPISNFYNPILFTHVNVHHDGHQSPIYLRNISFEQSLTGIEVLRFDGTKTKGFFGPSAPTLPYKGGLWFDSVTNVLKTYVVDFEGTLSPVSPVDNQYWYNRTTNELKKFSSNTWTTSTDNRWLVFSISDVYNNLILHAENILYDYWKVAFNTQPIVWDLSVPTYDQVKYLGFELSKFAIANNLDPYGSNYVASDAFTWNYSQSDFNTNDVTLHGIARWHKIYKTYFGTSRPDLEPWIILNITSADLASAIGLSETAMKALLSTSGSSVIWNYVLSQTTKKICVDPTTGIILPPYVSSTVPTSQYALITDYTKIINAASSYQFNDEGVVELVWRNTIDFNYSLYRASLKLDPVNALTKTWGFQTFNVNGLNYDKISKNIMTHYDFTLHSEPRSNLVADVLITGNVTQVSVGTFDFNLTVSSMVNDSIVLCNLEQGLSLKVGVQTTLHPVNGPSFNIKINERGNPLILGDKINVHIVDNVVTFTYVPTSTYIYNGLNQVYVNLKKYNNLGLIGDYNDYALRRWNASLIYRTNSLIEPSSLTLTSEQDNTLVNHTAYKTFLKINSFAKSSWLQALRIQIINIGAHKTLNSDKTIHIPSTDGSDWVFRVENYFSRYPALEKYITDTNGSYQTFNVLDGKHTDTAWKNFVDVTGKTIVHLPIMITGIQNVVTFLNDYIMFVTDAGWAVGQGDEPEIDTVTGRALTWELQVEKFIDSLYAGISAGDGLVINPFMKNVWFNTPSGMVSNFNHGNYDDVSTGQLVSDIAGDIIQPSALTVIRNDDITSISSQIPMFASHVNINEYEHVIIFNNYVNASLKLGLLYDQYLGIKINKIVLNGKRGTNQTNRPTYGGFYLNGNNVAKNIASAIDDVSNYYNTDAVYNNQTTTPHALALLGFTPKNYFSNLNIDSKSEFNFWRGMISAKGSNYSVEAFINSVKFETAKIDEFWAYKIAEYGDARQKDFPELKVQSNDTVLKHTRLFFSGTEDDTPNESMTVITNNDEDRWFTLSDLNTNLYFSAKVLETFYVTTTTANELVKLPIPIDELIVFGSKSNMMKLDLYVQEVNTLAARGTNVDGSFINAEEMRNILNEIDDLAKLDVTNTVQIVNTSYVNFPIPGDYSLIGYIPMRPTYSPIQLFDYVKNVHVEDIGVWHPAYDIHTPEALEVIDIVSDIDPSKYNYSLLTSDNVNYDPLKSWGNKEIGKIWWDTNNLDYVPYFDQYIFPSFEERLTRWGSLAEYSNINVYEWINSSVPPSEYNAKALLEQGDSTIDNHIKKTGNVAKPGIYKSTRTWNGRAIAWSYVANPSATEAIEMFVYSVDKLYLSTTSIGSVILVLENGTFSQYQLTSGMHLGGWIINKPYGELVLSTGTGYYVGTSYSIGDVSMTYPSDLIFSHFIVTINTKLGSTVSVGAVTFKIDQNGTNYYLTGTNDVSLISQSILLVQVNSIVGTKLDYNFDQLGFTISAFVSTNSTDYVAIGTEFLNNINLHIRNYQTGDIIIPFTTTQLDNQLPVVQPTVYSNTLTLSGLININNVLVTLNQQKIGNYSLSVEFDPNGDHLMLSNNGVGLQRILVPMFPSTTFDLVFDVMTFHVELTNLTSVDNFLSELVTLGSIIVVGLNGSVVQFVRTDTNVVITDYNWRAWNIPTAADLLADQSTPFSSWNPVYGDWIELPPTKDIISSITSYNAKPLTLNSGTTVQVYNSVWSSWSVLNDEYKHQISTVNSLMTFTMSNPISQNYFSLYINGINQLPSTYTLDPKYPTVVTLNNILPIGSKVTAYLRKYEPSTAELAFDPTIKDKTSTLVKYKIDYEYVSQIVRDSSGLITGKTYYFWVQNKSIAANNKQISIQQATNLLVNGPALYLTFQDMRVLSDSGYETIKFFDLSRYEIDSYNKIQIIYKAITIANLGTFVTKDNTYKLRFTRDFTLRDDPKELDLKNTHTEWTLLRANDYNKPPLTLWNKLVDSACGMDIIGNVLPSTIRIDYDKRHNTKTRYGFEPDQIFIETALLITSLKNAILNPKTTKWVNGQYVPDVINTLDYANVDNWFKTPASIRKLLTNIWDVGTGPQINGIFFEVLNDALANNYEFTDLFKTSRVSVHSITTGK